MRNNPDVHGSCLRLYEGPPLTGNQSPRPADPLGVSAVRHIPHIHWPQATSAPPGAQVVWAPPHARRAQGSTERGGQAIPSLNSVSPSVTQALKWQCFYHSLREPFPICSLSVFSRGSELVFGREKGQETDIVFCSPFSTPSSGQPHSRKVPGQPASQSACLPSDHQSYPDTPIPHRGRGPGSSRSLCSFITLTG